LLLERGHSECNSAISSPSGAHWLDDSSDLTCKDGTQQYPLDGSLLIGK
jgi:hypothetical protein